MKKRAAKRTKAPMASTQEGGITYDSPDSKVNFAKSTSTSLRACGSQNQTAHDPLEDAKNADDKHSKKLLTQESRPRIELKNKGGGRLEMRISRVSIATVELHPLPHYCSKYDGRS